MLNEMRTRFTRDFGALPLTSNHGWSTFDEYMVALPSHETKGKNNMFDPILIKKLMGEQNIVDLSPSVLFQCIIYQVSDMSDAPLNPEPNCKGKGKGKGADSSSDGKVNHHSRWHGALMSERGDLTGRKTLAAIGRISSVATDTTKDGWSS